MYLAQPRVRPRTFEGRREPLPEVARPTETTRAEGSFQLAVGTSITAICRRRTRTAICSCKFRS